VQVDPIKPALNAPGTKRLKLMYDGALSNFAFNFNLRRYSVGAVAVEVDAVLRAALCEMAQSQDWWRAGAAAGGALQHQADAGVNRANDEDEENEADDEEEEEEEFEEVNNEGGGGGGGGGGGEGGAADEQDETAGRPVGGGRQSNTPSDASEAPAGDGALQLRGATACAASNLALYHEYLGLRFIRTDWERAGAYTRSHFSST